MRQNKRVKRVLCVSLILFIVLLSLKFSEGKENMVCMTYFYVEGCGDCDEFKRILNSLEQNNSYLRVEQYDMMEHYELFEDLQIAYDAFYGVPMVFVGNEWYYFDTESEDFQNKLEQFVNCIVELERMGGVECVVGKEERLNFPKPVCVRAFYDFRKTEEVQFMKRVESALEGDVSFSEFEGFDVSDEMNYTILQGLCNATAQEFFLPCVFVGDTSFRAEEHYFSRIIERAKNHSKTGLSCHAIIYGKEQKDDNSISGFEVIASVGAVIAVLILKKNYPS